MSRRTKYSIVGHKGTGGYGTVYVARDRTGRLVALKLLNERMQEFVWALYQETVKLYDLLGAPGVVQLLDYDLNCDDPYIVLELAELSLHERLAGAPQPPKLAAAIGLQLARAVRNAHDRGILHFDIKPRNVLVMGGMLKIADFGLAKGVASLVLTAGGRGTPGYMAPEQARGTLTHAADVYGVGATLYEVLTGQVPPDGRADLDPRWIVSCPPELALLVLSMTATTPEHRPPLESVEAFCRGYLAPVPLPAVPAPVRRERVHTRSSAGGPLLLGGFVLAALALVAAGSSKR